MVGMRQSQTQASIQDVLERSGAPEVARARAVGRWHAPEPLRERMAWLTTWGPTLILLMVLGYAVVT